MTLVQQGAAAPGGQVPAPITATAQRAEYDATTQVMQLSGNPRIQEDNGEVSATSLELERTTGNANATGSVKATYRQAKGRPNMAFAGTAPVHVVADHAHLDHATDLTTFYGMSGASARLWQGSDSVSAPVLELSRAHATLSAHGQGGEAAAVNAVFASSPSPSKPAASPSVVRLQSRTLFYAENDHKAVFSGAVVAQTPTALVRSSFMDVYFSSTPAAAKSSPPPGAQGSQNSQVSKIVARGGVQLEEPGRKGTGEELTYTAADGKFLLTGTTARRRV